MSLLEDLELYDVASTSQQIKNNNFNKAMYNLPEDCIKIILNFYNTKNIFHVNKFWFNLKRYIYIYKLNFKYSNLLYENKFNPSIKNVCTIFKNHQIDNLENIKNACICFFENCKNITDINKLQNCKVLKINRCENIENIDIPTLNKLLVVKSNPKKINCKNLKYLYINKCSSNMVISFPHIESLLLDDCPNIDIEECFNLKTLRVSFCPRINDFTNFKKLKNLRINCNENYPFMNIQNNTNLIKLSLSRCNTHINLSSSLLKEIELRKCPNINFNNCKNIKKLVLSSCENIYDFSYFNKLSFLKIYGDLLHPINIKKNKNLKNLLLYQYNFNQFIKLSHLQNLKELYLDLKYRLDINNNCYKLPYLRKLQQISINGYKNINVENLVNVKNICIKNVIIVKQLHKLTSSTNLQYSCSNFIRSYLRYLAVAVNNKTKNILDLNTIPKNIIDLNLSNMVTSKKLDIEKLISLNISENQQINDLSKLVNLEKLNLSGCTKNRINISKLIKLKALDISNTYHNKYDLSNLINLVDLKISKTSCDYYYDLNNLKNLKIICMRDCNNMVNVNNLSHVKFIDLSECDNITDISPLKNVDRVIIDNCKGIKYVSMMKNSRYLSIKGCEHITDREQLNIPGIINE